VQRDEIGIVRVLIDIDASSLVSPPMTQQVLTLSYHLRLDLHRFDTVR